jgi:histidine phosphotransferase ChpT
MLSALLASRVCHDLINPVGALGSGLEVIDDGDPDPAMREAALDLIRNGGRKAIALLKFARLAYGSAGGFGAQIPVDEAEQAIRELYRWSKADIEWSGPTGFAPKDHVKIALILAQSAMDCVPRGGKVRVSFDEAGCEVVAEGPRALLNAEFAAALAGNATELKPKFAPAFIAGLLAREQGGAVDAALDGDRVVLHAKFAAEAKRAAAF